MEELFHSDKDVFGARLKKRKRGGVWRKLGILLLAGVIGAGAYLKFSNNDVPQNVRGALEAKRNPDLIFQQHGSDIVNILLIGRDVDYKPVYQNGINISHAEAIGTARSDSMIIMSLNKNKKTVRMVSLPRDAMVHMPPNKYHVRLAKLNAAHAYGGPELLIQTIHDELGITIHRYAVIKFSGFKHLIDKVGGIDVDVDGALLRDKNTHKIYRGDLNYDDNWGNLHIHIKKGPQHLDGQKAHDYVRYREDLEGDPGRIRRQQQVMRALAKKMMHQPFWKLPGLVDELQKQFISNMDKPEMASAAFFAQGIGDPSKIQPITLFGAFSTYGKFTLNSDKNLAILSTIFGSTFNQNNFLPNSPSTEGDELGGTNNSNPGAMEILREAGLISDGKGGFRKMKVASSEDSTAPPAANSNNAVTATAADDGVEEPLLKPGTSPLSPVDNGPAPTSTQSTHRHRSRRHRHSAVAADTNLSVSESSDGGTVSPVPQPEN